MSAAVWFQIVLEFFGNTWLESCPASVAAGYAIVAPHVVVQSADEGRQLGDPQVGQEIAIEVHNFAFVGADQVQHPLIAELVRADGVIVQSGSAIAHRNRLGRFDARLKLGSVPKSGVYVLRLVPLTIFNPPIPITELPRLTGRPRALFVNVIDAAP